MATVNHRQIRVHAKELLGGERNLWGNQSVKTKLHNKREKDAKSELDNAKLIATVG